jgi:hypothetical protein
MFSLIAASSSPLSRLRGRAGVGVSQRERFAQTNTAPQQRIRWTAQSFNRQIRPLKEARDFACIRSPPMWILLLLPFVGLLWVPFYNFQDPALFGFPFFYWYQLLWVPISSLLIWLVYRRRTPDEAP